MNLDIPIRSFFKFAVDCTHRETAPVIDGSLSDWDEEYRLPNLAVLDGQEQFAEFYASWNVDGLYFAVDVKKAPALEVQPDRPLRGDGLQIWVDTRDVRDAHRGSRYCHHFFVLPGKGSRKTVGGQVRLRRARAHSKLCQPDELQVACRKKRSGYSLEVHLPVSTLTGFDPEENNRLGFTYLLRDRKLGRQYWTADEPLPVSYDPSLWGTLVLSK